MSDARWVQSVVSHVLECLTPEGVGMTCKVRVEEETTHVEFFSRKDVEEHGINVDVMALMKPFYQPQVGRRPQLAACRENVRLIGTWGEQSITVEIRFAPQAD